MLQFRNFPIYVVYSLHRQQTVEPLWRHYYSQREAAWGQAKKRLFKFDLGGVLRSLEQYREKDSLIDGAIQWQLLEDLDPKYHQEIRDYEVTVENLLTTILHTSIGNKLLSMLKPDPKIFIIPADWQQPIAQTQLKTEEQGGGIRISFNPASFRSVFVSGRPAADETEETLLHELVHAMRLSQNRYSQKSLLNQEFNGSIEEFIATQFENIFHSSRRRSDMYSTYNGEARSKEDMYKFFIENVELVMALKYVLHSEPLAKAAAVLHQPDYNPFRDFGDIERRALKVYGLDKFMDL